MALGRPLSTYTTSSRRNNRDEYWVEYWVFTSGGRCTQSEPIYDRGGLCLRPARLRWGRKGKRAATFWVPYRLTMWSTTSPAPSYPTPAIRRLPIQRIDYRRPGRARPSSRSPSLRRGSGVRRWISSPTTSKAATTRRKSALLRPKALASVAHTHCGIGIGLWAFAATATRTRAEDSSRAGCEVPCLTSLVSAACAEKFEDMSFGEAPTP